MSTHESHTYVGKDKPTQSSDRTFGLVFTAIFLFFGLKPLFKHHPVNLPLVAIGVIILVMTSLLCPKALAPLNRVWTKLGVLLHHIISPIILGFVFFGVISPIGYFRRRLGKDPLQLSPTTAKTHWRPREDSACSDSRYQF